MSRPMGQRSLSAQRALALLKGVDDAAGDEGELSRAVELLGLGRAEAAEAEMLASLARNPRWGAAWLLLAEIREKRGDGAGRVEALRQAISLRPNDSAVHGRLTHALAAISDWRGASASAENEAVLNPDNPHTRAFLAAVLERLGEPERARMHIRRAVEIISADPQYEELRGELAKRWVTKTGDAPPA